MNFYFLKILQILVSISFVANENILNLTHITENSQNETEDITLPQLSTLEKFQNLGRAYTIPEGQSFSEFYENYKNSTPSAKNITSKNYPLPYPSGAVENFQIRVEDSTGIEIIVHILDIDPKLDYLKIATVTDLLDHNPKQFVLTGRLKEPLQLRALNIVELQLTFFAGERKESHNHQGFLITYKPFGKIPPPVTSPPDVTIPFDDLITISRLLVIEEPNQNNITWSNMKKVLCNATNSFLNSTEDVILEPCSPNNVTFTKVFKCPNYWPNSLTCIDLNFAISLYSDTSQMTTLDPFLENAMPKTPSGLDYKHLEEMWNKYGRGYMDAAGYPEYNVNTNESEFLLMGCVGIGVLLVCFIILLVLLKMGSFKRKWSSLEEEDSEETKEQEVDISMYPSPDQIVPVLFPGSISSGYNSAYEFENKGVVSGGGIGVRTFSEGSDVIDQEEENGYEDNVNLTFVGDDERMESNYSVQVNGVNKDEAHT